MAGLFFCLASAEGAGLLFCPAAIQPHTSVYSGLSVVNANYTAKTPKPFTGICSGVSVDLTNSSAHNTAATQAAYTPPTTRRRAYRQALHLHRYQIQPPRRTLYRPAQPPYYNNVYKGAPLLWIHARRCSITQTMPAATGQCIRLASCTGSARRLAIWRRVCLAHSTRRGSPVAGRGWWRGTIGGYRRISFRAFAR